MIKSSSLWNCSTMESSICTTSPFLVLLYTFCIMSAGASNFLPTYSRGGRVPVTPCITVHRSTTLPTLQIIMPGLVYRGTYIATLPKGLYIEAYTKLQCPRAYIQRHIYHCYNAPGLIYRGIYTLLQCPRATHLQLEVIHRGTVQHQSLVHIFVLLAHVDCHHYSKHNISLTTPETMGGCGYLSDCECVEPS